MQNGHDDNNVGDDDYDVDDNIIIMIILKTMIISMKTKTLVIISLVLK